MIAPVAVAALIILIERRIGLEVGAREVIQAHLEGDVEEVAPAPRQMREQRLFVREQAVMAAVQHVRIGERLICAEQIAQRRAPVLLSVQPPLAARCDQSIGAEHEQHQIPASSFARRRQSLGPEDIQIQCDRRQLNLPDVLPHVIFLPFASRRFLPSQRSAV